MVQTAMEGALTKTASYTPASGAANDIATFNPDLSLGGVHIEVTAASVASGTLVVSFALEDTVDTFTNFVTHAVRCFKGAVNSAATRKFFIPFTDLYGVRWNTTSARLRLKMVVHSGTTPSVSYRSWIEYNG